MYAGMTQYAYFLIHVTFITITYPFSGKFFDTRQQVFLGEVPDRLRKVTFYVPVLSRSIPDKCHAYPAGCMHLPKIWENRENFPRKPTGRNFREVREIFSGDSREFRKSPGTFPEIWGVFPEPALRSRVPVRKTGRKSRKIRVFSEKSHLEIPGKSPGKSPGNPRKNRAVFSCFFSGARKDTAYFWKIPGENSAGKFPDFREIFPREIPRIPENPGNFRKKRVKNDRFWKN